MRRYKKSYKCPTVVPTLYSHQRAMLHRPTVAFLLLHRFPAMKDWIGTTRNFGRRILSRMQYINNLNRKLYGMIYLNINCINSSKIRKQILNSFQNSSIGRSILRNMLCRNSRNVTFLQKCQVEKCVSNYGLQRRLNVPLSINVIKIDKQSTVLEERFQTLKFYAKAFCGRQFHHSSNVL